MINLYKFKEILSVRNKLLVRKSMGKDSICLVWSRTLVLVVLCVLSVSCGDTSSSTKGKVIEIDPSSVEYLANSFDQVLVFFLKERNEEL